MAKKHEMSEAAELRGAKKELKRDPGDPFAKKIIATHSKAKRH